MADAINDMITFIEIEGLLKVLPKEKVRSIIEARGIDPMSFTAFWPPDVSGYKGITFAKYIKPKVE